jgi:hypothetical protein
MQKNGPGRKPKGGVGVETTSITVKVPKPFKNKLLKMALNKGFGDLSSYIIAVLSAYTVDVELKKVDEVKSS